MSRETHEDGFIPGVHNYCDRWCERCAFSSRCRSYAIEMAIAVEGPEKALGDPEAWEDSEEGGPGLPFTPDAGEDAVADEEIEGEMLRHDVADVLARVHPLADAAKALIDLAAPLIEGAAARVEGRGPDAAAFRDPFETLARYRFFIPAKVHRALSGRESSEILDEQEALQSDANGSAKIAHITCAAAREAALRLGRLDPPLAQRAAAFAGAAERVLALLDEAFPHHRAFRRPGFDDPPQP
ncbi:MAG TPA: hypothetical protein VIG69_07250 [Candidatus Methylomirabilis sp.]|jgi:hypothetical protein